MIQLIEAISEKIEQSKLRSLLNRTKFEPKFNRYRLVAGKFGADTLEMEILDAAARKAVGAIFTFKNCYI